MKLRCRAPFFLTILLIYLPAGEGYIDGLYCGQENCYNVLNISRDATKDEIGKSYRQLARKNHPDRFKTAEQKKAAESRFRIIATAYETLRDDDQRTDYNYMLDNPDQYYQIYLRYYGRRVAPRVDVKIVITVFITVISVVQYFVLWNRYSEAIKYLMREPKYRSRALQTAIDEGLWSADKKKGRKSKEELKEDEDAIVKQILESKMEIRGGYAKPDIRDVLWVKIVCLPYHIFLFIRFHIRWIWRYNYKKLEFEEADKLYLVQKNLKYTHTQYESLPEKEKKEFTDKKLWITENFNEWKKEKDEKTKAEMAQNGKYKAYRRWMKKGGSGQITFGPDE